MVSPLYSQNGHGSLPLRNSYIVIANLYIFTLGNESVNYYYEVSIVTQISYEIFVKLRMNYHFFESCSLCGVDPDLIMAPGEY